MSWSKFKKILIEVVKWGGYVIAAAQYIINHLPS